MKRSAAAIAAAAHWAKRTCDKDRETEAPEGVQSKVAKTDTTTEADAVKSSLGATTTEDKNYVTHPSPLHLLTNPTVDDSANRNTFKLSSLIHAQDLMETFQFNFSVDLELFVSLLHPDFVVAKRPVTFITGTSLLDSESSLMSQYNLREVVAKTRRFGTHHTKMMINFYSDNSVEIAIMTCNITQIDLMGLSQMLWTSGRLPKRNNIGPSPSHFKEDLIQYLRAYREGPVTALANRLTDYDFSAVNVELIASVPGVHPSSAASYGYMKLQKVLRRNKLQVSDTSKHYSVVAQVSSLAFPYRWAKGKMASVLIHLIFPSIFGCSELAPGLDSCQSNQSTHNYSAHIVYPTVQEVANGHLGYSSGQALHFNYTKSPKHTQNYEQCVKPYLCKWGPPSQTMSGRERVPPHSKLLLCDNGDNFSTLRFVVMGSHNSSKQSWGAPSRPEFYEISSFELSVLVMPKEEMPLTPVYADTRNPPNSVPIRLPFILPPTRYSQGDKPWTMHIAHSTKDSLGRAYPGMSE